MSIPPLQALGVLTAAAPLAEAALSGASKAFADLLNAANLRGSNAPDRETNLPGLGLETLSSGPANDGESKLRGQTESLLGQFHQLLKKLMEDRNLDPNGGFQLQADDAGQIRVADGPAESTRIQEIFSSSAELRQLFDKIVANVNLLRLAAGSESAPNSDRSDVSLIVDANQTSVATG